MPPIPVGDNDTEEPELRWVHGAYGILRSEEYQDTLAFDAGAEAVGVELIVQVRMLESVGNGALLSATHEDVARVCEDLLARLGIRERCDATLDRLIAEATVRRGRRYVRDVNDDAEGVEHEQAQQLELPLPRDEQ
jgi:hypothetical protein